uniref:Ig-like domain-containing protein n=1 Tax=Hucho hucho TaxID=62062 RepID=A0A4W5KLS6_9TELE
MSVRVEGSPTPMVTWLKEESAEDVLWIKPDTKGYKVASSGRQHSLILMDVGSKHAGTYTCIATNKAGQSICTAQFEVEEAPRPEEETKIPLGITISPPEADVGRGKMQYLGEVGTEEFLMKLTSQITEMVSAKISQDSTQNHQVLQWMKSWPKASSMYPQYIKISATLTKNHTSFTQVSESPLMFYVLLSASVSSCLTWIGLIEFKRGVLLGMKQGL